MKRRSRIGALLAVASALLIISERAAAQSAGTADTLRQQVERRFDILPLHDGIALRPKAARRGVFQVMRLVDDQVVVLRQQTTPHLSVGQQKRVVDDHEVCRLRLRPSAMHVAVVLRAVDPHAVHGIARDAIPENFFATVKAQL